MPNTPEAEAGRHQVQGMPGLDSELKASLGDLIRLYIKSQKYEGWGNGLVKYLPCKHEDLSLNPQHPHGKAHNKYACYPSAGEGDTGSPWSSLSTQSRHW